MDKNQQLYLIAQLNRTLEICLTSPDTVSAKTVASIVDFILSIAEGLGR